MKTIAVFNHKGGVGKTTLTANIGYNMAADGNRVLLADCDPQGNLSSFFGRYDMRKKSIIDGLSGKKSEYRTAYKGLDIIPGNLDCEKIHPEAEAVAQMLSQYQEDYDICLIDCAPAYSDLTASALYAADSVLIPIRLDSFSIDGIDTAMMKIQSGKEVHIIVNAFNNSRAARLFLTKLLSYGYPLCESCVRFSTVVDAANYLHKPMARKARFHAITGDLRDLTKEVEGYAFK